MSKSIRRLAGILPTGGVLALAGMLAACGGGGVKTGPSGPAISFAAGAATAYSATPGQTVNIALAVTDAAAFTRGIAVVGNGHVGATAVKTQGPFDFSLALPGNLAPGNYRLTAMGYADGSDQALATASATLHVSLPANALLSLAPPPTTLVFEAIGEQLPIRVTGSTASGAVDLTESPRLSYQVPDASVAAVDGRGMVTARAEGQTSVALLMNGQTAANAPVVVLKPALLTSAAQLDFGTEAVGGSSNAQSLVITNNRSYPLSILEVSSPPDYPETDDCTSGSPLPAGQSCTIDVVFQPAAKGPAQGAIRIVDSAVSAATQVFLTGTGG